MNHNIQINKLLSIHLGCTNTMLQWDTISELNQFSLMNKKLKKNFKAKNYSDSHRFNIYLLNMTTNIAIITNLVM